MTKEQIESQKSTKIIFSLIEENKELKKKNKRLSDEIEEAKKNNQRVCKTIKS